MNYETAFIRPKGSIVYRILREILDERIKNADGEERARLIEQRAELDREYCGETRKV